MINKLLWSILILILLCIPVLWFWSSVTRYDEVQPDGKVRTAAIVLGAAVRGQGPSPALEERLNMACELYKHHLVTFIVLTGGQGLGRSISEAEVGKKYLIHRGVPQDRLFLENRSTTTQENFQFSSAILRKHKLFDIYLVTHDYHMNRALYYAKEAHIQASPAPVHTKVLFMPLRKAQESYSLVKLKILSCLSN